MQKQSTSFGRINAEATNTRVQKQSSEMQKSSRVSKALRFLWPKNESRKIKAHSSFLDVSAPVSRAHLVLNILKIKKFKRKLPLKIQNEPWNGTSDFVWVGFWGCFMHPKCFSDEWAWIFGEWAHFQSDEPWFLMNEPWFSASEPTFKAMSLGFWWMSLDLRGVSPYLADWFWTTLKFNVVSSHFEVLTLKFS